MFELIEKVSVLFARFVQRVRHRVQETVDVLNIVQQIVIFLVLFDVSDIDTGTIRSVRYRLQLGRELLRLQRRQALMAYETLPVSFQRVRHVAKDFNRVHLFASSVVKENKKRYRKPR